MFALFTQQNYPSNGYKWHSDIGDPAMIDFQVWVSPFTKTLWAAGNIEYADGAYLTYRGISFAGYLYPSPEILNNNPLFVTWTDSASRFISHTYNTGTHSNCKIRTNYLLNRRIFQDVKLANFILFELLTTFTGAISNFIVSSPTVTIVLKKVNSAWSVTTLKTISSVAITAPSGITSRFDKNLITDANTIATLTADDVFFLDVEINYSALTSNGSGTFWIANNAKSVCRISYDL